jgi:hypothetical protein
LGLDVVLNWFAITDLTSFLVNSAANIAIALKLPFDSECRANQDGSEQQSNE